MTVKLNSPTRQIRCSYRTIAIAMFLLTASAFLAAQTEKVIYTFAGEPDGQWPYANVVFDRAGNLYGTTDYGGASNAGTIFKLTRSGSSWIETILYSFGTTSADGNYPGDALVFDAKGNLYGTAVAGGSKKGGTAFQLSPPTVSGGSWTLTVLASFALVNRDYSVPCGLVWVNGRHLFGIAVKGGIGYGSIFELTPPATSGGTWSESTVYSFAGSGDGQYPGSGCSPLIADKSGNLYGTTWEGGSGSYGTVFELSPPATSGGTWTKTILHNFDYGTTDGFSPQGSVTFDANGNLFGTTSDGGTNNRAGVIFELSPASGGTWTESVLYNFGAYSTDGSYSYSGVIFDRAGNMYGTTLGGGATNDGTVWRLTPPSTSGGAWTETQLHGFTDGPDGREVRSGLIAGPGGVLYGTTQFGGNSNEDGVVYQVVP